MKTIRGLLVPFFISVMLLTQRCGTDIPVVYRRAVGSPYRTEHFTIYYDEAVFDPIDIEQIGVRKESHLDHINEYLGTDYDRQIVVQLHDSIAHPYAQSSSERVYESPDYVLTSDYGHETAHVIGRQKWGPAPSQFFTEGLAEAAAKHPEGFNAMERFGAVIDNSPYTERLVFDSTFAHMRGQILRKEGWYSSHLEYVRAGAFFHYLKVRFGIEKVEILYRTRPYPGEIDQSVFMEKAFKAAFGATLDTIISDFKTEYRM